MYLFTSLRGEADILQAWDGHNLVLSPSQLFTVTCRKAVTLKSWEGLGMRLWWPLRARENRLNAQPCLVATTYNSTAQLENSPTQMIPSLCVLCSYNPLAITLYPVVVILRPVCRVLSRILAPCRWCLRCLFGPRYKFRFLTMDVSPYHFNYDVIMM